MLLTETIDGCLDRRIQQLDDQNEDTTNDQDEPFEARAAEPDRKRNQQQCQGDFLAKRRLVLPRMCKTLCGKSSRADDPAHSGIAGFSHYLVTD